MTWVVYQNAKGRQYTFQLLEKDGKTPRIITGLTVTLRLKALDDPTVLLSSAVTITNSTLGEFYVTMSTTLSGTVRKYTAQFEVTDGANTLLDPSEEFVFIVRKSAAIAG